MTMETYYVTAYETFVRDYKVEAESKEEAIQHGERWKCRSLC